MSTNTNKSKIQQLAELTTDDLSQPESPLPETLFPAIPKVIDPTAPRPQQAPLGTGPRKPTDPRPQLEMLTEVRPEGQRRLARPVIRNAATDPDLDETVVAMLVMASLVANYAGGFWQVKTPDASNYTATSGGGNRARWQTGVRVDATHQEWMREINNFFKARRPGEPLPFGNV